jgi:hypothetical protein
LIRSFDRSRTWRLEQAPGARCNATRAKVRGGLEKVGGRPCAVFEYVGAAGDRAEARRVLGDGVG